MALPKGLTFKNRVASGGKRWYFLCQRKGHGRVWSAHSSATLAGLARTEHDAEHHSRRGGTWIEPRTVGELANEFLDHMERLVARGTRDHKTHDFYRRTLNWVRRGFGDGQLVHRISPALVREYIDWRLTEGLTEGAVVRKELKALQRALRWKYGRVDWAIPVDEIPNRPQPRRTFTRAELEAFADELEGIPKAVVLLKMRVPLRNVEIEELKAGDIDLERGSVRIILHNKRRPIPYEFPVPSDALEALRPYVEGKDPEAPVFRARANSRTFRIRRLEKSFRSASKRAGIEPPIQSIAVIRHHLITWSANMFGVALTSRSVGHQTEQTTAGYVIDDGDFEKKQQMAESVAARGYGLGYGEDDIPGHLRPIAAKRSTKRSGKPKVKK